MANQHSIQVMQCPNCGAPVEMTGDGATCSYCGAKLQRQQPAERVVRERIVERVIVRPEPVVRSRRRGSPLSSVLAVLILLGVIGVCVYIAQKGNIAGLNLSGLNNILPPYVVGRALPLSLEGGKSPDLLLLTQDLTSETVRVADLKGAGDQRGLRWSGQPLSKEGGRAATLVANAGMIYVVDQASVIAYNVDAGAVVWQSSLANALNESCREKCLRLLGDHLVTLARDGTLQSFDARTGKPAWSKRLNDTAAQLLAAGDKPLVVDKREDSPAGVSVTLYDPASGAAVRRLAPACQTGFGFGGPIIADTFLTGADGQSLFIVSTWVSGCVQRWDLGTGKLAWETDIEDGAGWPNSFAQISTALSEDGAAVYVANTQSSAGALFALDARSGKYRKLLADQRYGLTVQAAQPGAVILSAVPDFDGEQTELWGVDPATGMRAWQRVLRTQGILAKWTAHLSGRGLVLVQCPRDDKQCSVEQLDPATGVSPGETKLDKPRDFQQLEAAEWSDRWAALTIGGRAYVLDLTNDTLYYAWP
jgi:outer membrane protein assembly factor BamB